MPGVIDSHKFSYADPRLSGLVIHRMPGHFIRRLQQVAVKLFSYVRQGPPPSRALLERLTVRERAILRLLASGLTNVAIGERLSLAEGTVRNHVSTILAKLEVSDRAQATAIAWRSGLVGHDALEKPPGE